MNITIFEAIQRRDSLNKADEEDRKEIERLLQKIAKKHKKISRRQAERSAIDSQLMKVEGTLDIPDISEGQALDSDYEPEIVVTNCEPEVETPKTKVETPKTKVKPEEAKKPEPEEPKAKAAPAPEEPKETKAPETEVEPEMKKAIPVTKDNPLWERMVFVTGADTLLASEVATRLKDTGLEPENADLNAYIGSYLSKYTPRIFERMSTGKYRVSPNAQFPKARAKAAPKVEKPKAAPKAKAPKAEKPKAAPPPKAKAAPKPKAEKPPKAEKKAAPPKAEKVKKVNEADYPGNGRRPILRVAIVGVMGKDALSAPEIVERLTEKKWLPTSSNPREAVSHCLSTNTPETFERTETRGVYRVKKSILTATKGKSPTVDVAMREQLKRYGVDLTGDPGVEGNPFQAAS